ncbi:MAG: 3-oxoacyl-ACP reductase [Gammaproteobacteria bacterium]|nr:MAG: 3-oxoacyl-ACP reductase [Gammaproteobacteria bacterium]
MASVALVTGGGTGLGRIVAHTLAGNGFEVTICGRTAATLADTVATAPAGARIDPITADVSDEQSVEALFDTLIERHGRLDVLFNNAGINVAARPIDEIPVAEWRQVIDVNLHGAFLVARAAFARMRRQDPQGGRIINNGSISAHVPRPGSVPYTVSKHAITGLTRTLSLDGRAFDIACGQIDIGNAASAMTETISSGIPQADGSVRAEPTMPPQSVGDAVLHMASLPLSANVQFMTIMASGMPYIGRG